MIRFCQPVLNAVFKSDPPNGMWESEARTLLPLNKLHAINRHDCMVPVSEPGCRQFACCSDQPQQRESLAFIAELGNVNVEVANLVVFELAGLFPVAFR